MGRPDTREVNSGEQRGEPASGLELDGDERPVGDDGRGLQLVLLQIRLPQERVDAVAAGARARSTVDHVK